MKIYTFNALEDTRVEILFPLRPNNKDLIFAEYIKQANYTEVDSIEDCHIAIYPRRVFNPETLKFDRTVYDAVEMARKHRKPLIVDATSDSDIFINIPDARVLRCGLYQSLQRSFETECPFWSNHRSKVKLDALEITPKRQKPAVGFCGTTASIGKLSNMTKFFIPNVLAEYLLSQGKLASKIDIRVREGMSLKLRETSIKLVASDKRLDSNFALTNDQKSYYCDDQDNRIFLENLFIENTRKSDYVLCVRGTGNYSGRFYMTLNAGRIPVVLDTDIVIPYEDKLNLVKIPASSLNQIGDFIAEHFASTTESEFKEMKIQNREVYHQFLAPEKFFPNFIDGILNSNLTV